MPDLGHYSFDIHILDEFEHLVDEFGHLLDEFEKILDGFILK